MPVRRKTIQPTSQDATNEIKAETVTKSVAQATSALATLVTKVNDKKKSLEISFSELLSQITSQAQTIEEADKKYKEAQKEADIKRAQTLQERDFQDELEQKKAKAKLAEELVAMRANCERDCATKRERVDRDEAEINAKKEEIAKMKKQIEVLPKELSQAVADAEKSTKETLTKDFEIQKKLLLIESENTIKLMKQEIESMKSQVVEKDALISSLTAERNAAIGKVQELATEAMKRSQPQLIREVAQNVG